MYYKAYLVLKHHTKWEATTDILPPTQSDSTIDETQLGVPENPSSDNCNRTKAVPHVDLFAGGSRGAKNDRQEEEVRTQTVRLMAQSMKHTNEIMEERNAIEVFSRPEAAYLPETEDFSLR